MGQIGSESCNASSACQDNEGEIGSDACNVTSACQDNLGGIDGGRGNSGVLFFYSGAYTRNDADGVTLKTGATSLLDQDGSALVLHAKPDDYRTDPSGAAGDRLACGVMQKQ